MNHTNNLALIELSKVWLVDGDWMRCRACKSVLIASRDGEPLRHKADCEHAARAHPWAELRQAMDVCIGANPPQRTGAAGSEDNDDWRDDPSTDERWNSGLDFAMGLLCDVVGVDRAAVNWDAATETLDGDVCAVIANILQAGFGDEWNERRGPPPASPSPPVRETVGGAVDVDAILDDALMRMTDSDANPVDVREWIKQEIPEINRPPQTAGGIHADESAPSNVADDVGRE